MPRRRTRLFRRPVGLPGAISDLRTTLRCVVRLALVSRLEPVCTSATASISIRCADCEAVWRFTLVREDLYSFHARGGWTLAAALEHRFHRAPLSGKKRLNRPIAAIAHPTA